jgi:hypothetical protein
MKASTTNPTGSRGKPIVVPNMSLDSALRKILAAPPEPKPKSPKKTPAKNKQA